jgi:Leucine-rich repeat (LRR) protein
VLQSKRVGLFHATGLAIAANLNVRCRVWNAAIRRETKRANAETPGWVYEKPSHKKDHDSTGEHHSSFLIRHLLLSHTPIRSRSWRNTVGYCGVHIRFEFLLPRHKILPPAVMIPRGSRPHQHLLSQTGCFLCRYHPNWSPRLLRAPNQGTYNSPVTTTTKPRRRWFQYSLRTLLVLMLLACIGMGWLAVKLQRVRQEQAAVAAIEGLGGSVVWAYPDLSRELPGRAWLRKLLGDGFFARPDFVEIRNDAAMEYLTELTHIPNLLLIDTQFTDTGLEHLKELTRLRKLYLVNTQVTSDGLRHLKGLTQLTTLFLIGIPVTDAGLEHLTALTQLQLLYLDSTQVTDAGLEHLSGLTHLQSLSLHGTPVTGTGLKHFKGLTQLQSLSLEGTPVTDAGLAHFDRLTQLEELSLNGTRVTDAGLEHLKRLSRLKILYLGGTQITDAGLDHLNGLTQLRELHLTNTQVSDSGVRKLQQALPNFFISR